MIEVTDLVKCYRDYRAVCGVSFKAATGSVVGLLGPNGAGKTTIMKVLTGYHRPSKGTVLINGVDVDEDPLTVKASVGYLPEGVPLYIDMTVGEYLGFVSESRGIPPAKRVSAMEKACVACGLSGMADIRIEHLSKGFRQRVGLAQAIIHDPPILILDEPTTGLDPNQIMEIRTLIRSLGVDKTVILSTHILQEVEALCSEVIILNDGLIVAQGSGAEIARSLQGEERLDCVFRRADPPSVALAFRNHPLFISSSISQEPGGNVRLSGLALSVNADAAAEALFDWAAGCGAKILELRRQRMSLEQVFAKLTMEVETI